MIEKFIERGTDYPLQNGKLSIYETNCVCKNVKFYFEQHVFTLMLSGHKTIETDNLKFEFFPSTFFIPEKGTINEVSIPNASIDNPTKCLVLELNPSYLHSIYEEVLYSDDSTQLLYNHTSEIDNQHFFSNDKLLNEAFIRLYENQIQTRVPSKSLIDSLIIKEMLLRLFSTEALLLLKTDFEKSITDHKIQKAVSYIRANIREKLTAQKLAKVSGLGQTTFFKKFKLCTGRSPIDYILHERIRQAKILIQKDNIRLQEIAFKCGFNSYEYFCISFKKITKSKPSELRKSIQGKNSSFEKNKIKLSA